MLSERTRLFGELVFVGSDVHGSIGSPLGGRRLTMSEVDFDCESVEPVRAPGTVGGAISRSTE